MSAQHTPGPWRVVEYDNGAYILPPGDLPCVTAVAIKGVGRNYDEAEANARLIVAAPDLLAVLERIAIAADAPRGAFTGEAVLCTQFLELAKAEIAKAKGEA